MKVRYPTKCARCLNLMQPGVAAVRHAGGLWHIECLQKYHRQRLAVRGRALTGK